MSHRELSLGNLSDLQELYSASMRGSIPFTAFSTKWTGATRGFTFGITRCTYRMHAQLYTSILSRC